MKYRLYRYGRKICVVLYIDSKSPSNLSDFVEQSSVLFKYRLLCQQVAELTIHFLYCQQIAELTILTPWIALSSGKYVIIWRRRIWLWLEESYVFKKQNDGINLLVS